MVEDNYYEETIKQILDELKKKDGILDKLDRIQRKFEEMNSDFNGDIRRYSFQRREIEREIERLLASPNSPLPTRCRRITSYDSLKGEIRFDDGVVYRRIRR